MDGLEDLRTDQTIHYENMPIQIQRKIHLKKLKKISDKNLLHFFFIFLLKT